ncbi:WD40-repeat-containing domain protein [Lactarius hatsudake]|nr:WD40-repeat-containing domain protein [Lactarius hatsudake]
MNPNSIAPAVLHAPGFAHYNLAWSPFHTTRIAVASSANYGIVGNGRLHLASVFLNPSGAPDIKLDKFYETQDSLYDLAWSEVHENQLVTASGDGSLKLWDVTLNTLPIRSWHEHTREVYGVDWSNIKKDQFVSCCMDGSVKIWTPERPRSLTTLQAHHACVYQALFSPHQPDLLATSSGDGTIRFFDLRSPSFSPSSNTFTAPLSAPVLTVPAAPSEELALDWNKYRPLILASAGLDKTVKIWDCRMLQLGASASAVGSPCENRFYGHEYAVRKVQWSPHRPDLIASGAYDMTCRVWTTNPPPGQNNLVRIHDAHTEFVVGCAWSLYEEGVLATMDPEDILSSSLETLYDYTPITHSSPGGSFTYIHRSEDQNSDAATAVTVSTPDTQAEHWSLHASSIWVSALYVADHISELGLPANIKAAAGVAPLRLIELGAGAGLPSILTAKVYPHVHVIASDFPDPLLIHTLRENVARNDASTNCSVVPHAWGTDPSALLLPGADIVLAADTLWNPELHAALLHTTCGVLARTPAARAHFVAGLHTGRYTLDSFLRAAGEAGLELVEATEREVHGEGRREWDVRRAESEDERERRRWVVWSVLKWRDL